MGFPTSTQEKLLVEQYTTYYSTLWGSPLCLMVTRLTEGPQAASYSLLWAAKEFL